MTRHVFHGRIAGLGSTSGIRVVLGNWSDTSMGSFADAMVALPDGHRILLAPTSEVASFIGATYSFDEIRIEPFTITGEAANWAVRSPSLSLDVDLGRRTWLGGLLRLVPRRLAHAPWWIAMVDGIARLVLRGVRVAGETKSGRKEWYGATDNHAIADMSGTFEGADLGDLAPVLPSPTFGFSSTPPRPSVTAICTTVEVPDSNHS